MREQGREVEIITERERAELILHPLRLRILEAARVPASAAGLARRLGLKPQKVNYHVRRLSEAGFLRPVEERQVGNVVETVYAASAESYVLATEVLGGLSPRATATSAVTAGRWLALQARAESELGELMGDSADGSRALGALSLDAEFRFETAEQRAMFARAVRDVFSAVVTKYTSPHVDANGEANPGRPYRMIVGCYPVPDASAGAEARTPGFPG